LRWVSVPKDTPMLIETGGPNGPKLELKPESQHVTWTWTKDGQSKVLDKRKFWNLNELPRELSRIKTITYESEGTTHKCRTLTVKGYAIR
jgi:hypothetical protein